MKGSIEELWHGNIIPQEDGRTNSQEMKELLGYMARHHEDLEKRLHGREERNLRELHVASQKQLSVVFDAAKPPKATSWQSRAGAGDRQRLCDGGEKLERIRKSCRRSNLRICLQARWTVDARNTLGTAQKLIRSNQRKHPQKLARLFRNHSNHICIVVRKYSRMEAIYDSRAWFCRCG